MTKGLESGEEDGNWDVGGGGWEEERGGGVSLLRLLLLSRDLWLGTVKEFSRLCTPFTVALANRDNECVAII